MTDPIALSGAPGSPYTRKMLAVLRYRRIPYRFLLPTNPVMAKLPRPKVQLLPTFYLPDDAGELAAVTDSTPLIRRFERDLQTLETAASHLEDRGPQPALTGSAFDTVIDHLRASLRDANVALDDLRAKLDSAA